MRISCSTRWCTDISAEQALDAIASAGFEYIDLVIGDEASSTSILDNLRPGLAQLSGLHWFDSSNPGRIRDGIREAKARGIQVLTLGALPRQQESMQYFVQTLELALADLADNMSLELINHNDTRLEQLEDFRELFVRVQHPRLTVAIDAVESHRASVNPTGAIRELGDRMTRLIVGDLIGSCHVPLGEGEVNIAAVIEQARRISYNGWLVLEPSVSDPKDPREDLVHERERLLRILEG